MDQNYISGLKNLSILTSIPISIYNKDTHVVETYGPRQEDAVAVTMDNTLTNALMSSCEGKRIPTIYVEDDMFYFGSFKKDDGEYVVVGPVCVIRLPAAQIHKFCEKHGIVESVELQVVHFELSRFLALQSLLFEIVTGNKVNSGDILKESAMMNWNPEEVEARKLEIQLKSDEYQEYHHTYLDELRLIQQVKCGRCKEAMEALENLLPNAGRLGKNGPEHYHNLAVAAIALLTRAAIEGGVSPAESYKMSDLMINKLQDSKSSMQKYEIIRISTEEFVNLVNQAKDYLKPGDYVERCKVYVREHYQEPIRLGDIANALGVNQNYLSRLFSKTEEMTMHEYILRIRVNQAERLLRYSDMSLAEIGAYLCFNSQSHFGSVFKKYRGITPQQYRDMYRIHETATGKDIE